MKFTLAMLALLTMTMPSYAQETDHVKTAEKTNKKKEERKTVTKDVADFLVTAADARMMDEKEGKLASQRATTAALREYGTLMMRDQAILLGKIKEIALAKNVTLPTGISNKKAESLEDLSKMSGKEFDEKFIKMITLDHERDVKIFKEVIGQDDKDVKEFAIQNLPMIQSHLDEINRIKDSMK